MEAHFSYGRVSQQAALKTWSGKQDNEQAAQEAFSHRAKMNMLAATRVVRNLEG